MALSGVVGYFVASASPLMEVHETVAPLMWAYLIGHVVSALFHELRGERIIAAMFYASSRQ